MGGVSTASTAQAAQPVLKMRIASSSNSNASINGAFVWLRAFMDSADADGIKTVFYPGSALGKEAERTELVNLGLIQLNMIGLSELQIYSAAARAFSIPFMIDGYQQLENLLLETDFLPSLNEELSKTNLMVVDLAILGGMSGLFTTRKPVRSLSDMRGLRLRAMGGDEITTISSWGSSSVQVAWEEVPQALETGIAGGYLNPPLAPIMFGHLNQIRYFTDLRLAPSCRWAVVARTWYENLSENCRNAVDRAIAAGRDANRRWTAAIHMEEERRLREAGIEIIALPATERQKFASAAQTHFRSKLPPAIFGRMERWAAQSREGDM